MLLMNSAEKNAMRSSLQVFKEDWNCRRGRVPISLLFAEIARVVTLIRLALLDLVENHPKQILVPEFRRGLFCRLVASLSRLDDKEHAITQVRQYAGIVDRHGRRRIENHPVKHRCNGIEQVF